MINYEKPDKDILDLIRQREEDDLKRERERAEFEVQLQRQYKEEQAKLKNRQEEQKAFEDAVQDYALKLIKEYKSQGKRVPKELKGFDEVVLNINLNTLMIENAKEDIKKLEERKKELEENLESLKQELNADAAYQKSKETYERSQNFLKGIRSYRSERSEEKERLNKEFMDAWYESAIISSQCGKYFSEIEKIEDQIRTQTFILTESQEALKKDQLLRSEFIKKFGPVYEKAMSENGFLDEENIPIVLMLQLIIKGVHRDDVDMPFVKHLKLTKEKIDEIIKQRPKRFVDIVSGALRIEPEKIDSYFTEIGLQDHFIKLFEIRGSIANVSADLENLYDKNDLYYNRYLSEIDAKEHTIEVLRSKEKEISSDFSSKVWTIDEIKQGHKISPITEPVSR